LDDNPDAVANTKASKQQAVGAIVGSVMRETRGRADGKKVNELISKLLA
jgi:aspartyl-tRNA(Asn)/glutamyl-tRNA(Gln) amidotransferase subunit B